MIDLKGIARRHDLPVEQLQVAAELVGQGFTPSFIARYRADESGNLAIDVLWDLKLAHMQHQRLQAAKARHLKQLPAGAELDEEAQQALDAATCEAEVEAALRCFRARRNLVKLEQQAGDAGKLLEELVAFSGQKPSDMVQWLADARGIDRAAAEKLMDQVQELMASLIAGDTRLQEKLRRIVREQGRLRFEFTSSELEPNKQPAKSTQPTPAASPVDDAEDKPASPANAAEAQVAATSETKEIQANAAGDGAAVQAGAAGEPQSPAAPPPGPANQSSPPIAELQSVATEPTPEPTESASTTDTATAAATDTATHTVTVAADSNQVAGGDAPTADPAANPAPDGGDSPAAVVPPSAPDKTGTPGSSTSQSQLGKQRQAADGPAAQASKKETAAERAKLTPRQRRRRWLETALHGLPKKGKPIGKWSAYQHLLIARGWRSQIIRPVLEVDNKRVVRQARDAFVARSHPLVDWFESAVESVMHGGALDRVKHDVLAQCEQEAQDRLLAVTAGQLRRRLAQRPVRGHTILVIDTVGPKNVCAVVIGPAGEVLATSELDCSARPDIVDRNVIHLGELVHRFRVSLVAITNGPARRFMIATLRELMRQSADSGLRWTVADRSAADAYASSPSSHRELSSLGRRVRAAVWAGRALQDPVAELLKVDVNRLRLGSYQRELPTEALRDTVRTVLADAVYCSGLDVWRARRDDLVHLPGISQPVANQIHRLAESGQIASRRQLAEQISDWDEKQRRQAIAALRILEGDQPLDATLIHPDDYSLAERLAKHTDLELPPAAPEGWTKPSADAPSPADTSNNPPSPESSSPGTAPAAELAEGSTSPAGCTSLHDQTLADAPAAPVADPGEQGASTDQERGKPAAAIEPDGAPAAGASGGEAEHSDATENQPESEPGATAAETQPAASAASAAQEPASADETPAKPAESALAPSDPTPNARTQPAGQHPRSLTAPPSHRPFVYARYAEPEIVDSQESSAAPTLPIDVEALAKQWQVGRSKLKWVAHCLHRPFGDWRETSHPIPMHTRVPELTELTPGMCLWAVVVGVADFGAFAELGPNCSGLIHVSRLSTEYVEDPHQIVQVGDLIMVWVDSVDEGNQRVALTALSPAQRAALATRRQEHRQGREGDRRRGGRRDDNRGPRRTGDAPVGDDRRAASSGPGRSGRPARENRRDNRRDRRRGGREERGPRRPRSIVIESKAPKAPISPAMREGNEPLRSFADLMQFYQEKRTSPPPAADAGSGVPTDEQIPSTEPQQPEQQEAPDVAPPPEQPGTAAQPTAPAAGPSDSSSATSVEPAGGESTSRESSDSQAATAEGEKPAGGNTTSNDASETGTPQPSTVTAESRPAEPSKQQPDGNSP